MQNWFLLALAAPFLWSLVTIIDKFLVSKYTKETDFSAGSLVLFSSFVGLVVCILISFTTPEIFLVSLSNKLLLLLGGALGVAWVIFYLHSLEIEEVSNVSLWMLLIPIFGYILGHIFLGEVLTHKQLLGSFIVLIGAGILSVDFSKEKISFKAKVIFLMLCSCFMYALTGIIFKFVTIENNFWVSIFWEHVGLFLSGLILFFFIPKYRRDFINMIKDGGRKIFFFNFFGDIMTILGNLVTYSAILLAPVTLVYLVSTFQPIITLMMTFVLTIFLPKVLSENFSKKVIFPKIIAVIIMIAGSAILFI